MTEPIVPAAAPASTSQSQVVDHVAIAASAAEAATKAAMKTADERATKVAAEKLAQVGRALIGEQPQDVKQQVLQRFVDNPLETMNTITQAATDRAMKQVDARLATESIQRNVVGKHAAEYPELKGPNKLALIEKLAEQYERNGDSYSLALDKACTDTVKEFGLQSVSEAQRTGAALHTGLPGGGGMGSGAPRRDEAKSNSDFMAGMRAKMSATRNKVKV